MNKRISFYYFCIVFKVSGFYYSMWETVENHFSSLFIFVTQACIFFLENNTAMIIIGNVSHLKFVT